MKNRKNKKLDDFLKASRRGSRDAELENSTGFRSVNKKHKSLKDYKRRPKHKAKEGVF